MVTKNYVTATPTNTILLCTGRRMCNYTVYLTGFVVVMFTQLNFRYGFCGIIGYGHQIPRDKCSFHGLPAVLKHQDA